MSSIRIERCDTDNIYLIESLPPEEDNPYERNFLIMDNSGNTYTVTISNYPSCTCPDYTTRGNRCKHIYFVLIRIMNIDDYDDYTQEIYTDEELEEMFMKIPQIAKNLIYHGEEPQEQKEVKQKFEKGDICPICLDPLENGKELDYCKYSCGKTIHKKCFSMWEKSKGGICVFCRGNWYSNFPSEPKPVSMHPIEQIQIDEKEEEDKKDNSYYEDDYIYEKIDIDEESFNNTDEVTKREKERDKRRNKRKKKCRKKSRDKSKSSKMSISRSVSRSRSRSHCKCRRHKRNRCHKD
jgi:hypothetical protein